MRRNVTEGSALRRILLFFQVFVVFFLPTSSSSAIILSPLPRFLNGSNTDVVVAIRKEMRTIFRHPGRKCLDDICRLHLLETQPAPMISFMWNERHKATLQYWGRVISTQAYTALQPRLSACPYFVVPCFRPKALFNAVTNFDRDLVGVSPLSEWKKNQGSTQVHMTIQFFTELARSKGLVLVRCEIRDQIFTKRDLIFVTQMLLKYYTVPQLYEAYVETFNKRPNQFDYHQYLRQMKDEANKDNVTILDKKFEGHNVDPQMKSLDLPSLDEIFRATRDKEQKQDAAASGIAALPDDCKSSSDS